MERKKSSVSFLILTILYYINQRKIKFLLLHRKSRLDHNIPVDLLFFFGLFMAYDVAIYHISQTGHILVCLPSTDSQTWSPLRAF